jgi:hypothetical protein
MKLLRQLIKPDRALGAPADTGDFSTQMGSCWLFIYRYNGMSRLPDKMAQLGCELAMCSLLIKAWTAMNLQRFFGARQVAGVEQCHRSLAELPVLRNCQRCSKIECSTS